MFFLPGEGVIDSVLKPGFEWRVRINGVYWKARAAVSSYDFKPNDFVRPVDRDGLILFVEPTKRACMVTKTAFSKGGKNF